MEFRVDAKLCYKLGNKNSDADRIECSRWPHDLNLCIWSFANLIVCFRWISWTTRPRVEDLLTAG